MYKFARIAAFLFLVFSASVAHAGPYTDDLGKCLVKSTTSDDQVVFMQWMFSALSLHPAVNSLTTLTDEQRAAFNKKVAGLFVRLMSADCRQQTIDALKYEGTAAMQASFQLFGAAAMRGLMGNSHVAKGLEGMAVYFQQDQNWMSVLREAGIAK